MSEVTISGAMLRDMFLAGAALLEKNKEAIDALNVFPVPDGDTGTNMTMTVKSAMREVAGCECATVTQVADSVSLGALKGARGNSGVILSQLFRGFAKALKGQSVMDSGLFATALEMGADAGYKAVMKPKEGTILTVARSMAEAVRAAAGGGANVYKLVDIAVEAGQAALLRTPEQLPVLKEAGVVDSGGKGLVCIYRGFKMAVDGEDIEDIANIAMPEDAVAADETAILTEDADSIKYGYCTEFFIIHIDPSFGDDDLSKFRDKLLRIGDSVVVAHEGELVKVHVHSDSPGKIIQLALRIGEVSSIKIDNMREQNREKAAALKQSEREYAIIAVSAGEGLDKAFTDLGVAFIISGGQTMNPSIESILKAVERVNARNVFVLPNNSNIILAARQAATVSKRNVIVIPTKTLMQGMAAVMGFTQELSVKDNTDRMTAQIETVSSGSVTYAVRDTTYNGMKICEGDIMALLDGSIVEDGKTVDDVTAKLVKRMIAARGDDSVVTLFYGEGVDESSAQALADRLGDEYPEAEFLVQLGGQPLYYYFISVE